MTQKNKNRIEEAFYSTVGFFIFVVLPVCLVIGSVMGISYLVIKIHWTFLFLIFPLLFIICFLLNRFIVGD